MIALTAGVGAGAQSFAWRLSRSRHGSSWRMLVGGPLVNCLAGAGVSMIATYFAPEAPWLVVGSVWVLAWAFDFSRDDTKALWSSRALDLLDAYLRSRKGDRKDDQS